MAELARESAARACRPHNGELFTQAYNYCPGVCCVYVPSQLFVFFSSGSKTCDLFLFLALGPNLLAVDALK
jgi:hypothetical protein